MRVGLIEDFGDQRVDLAAYVAYAAELADLLYPGPLAGDGGLLQLVAQCLGTNCRSDMPCLAALDLARRTMLSGISSVVFIVRWSAIWGWGVKGLMPRKIINPGKGGTMAGS